MDRRPFLALAAATASLFLVACSGSPDSRPSPPPFPTTEVRFLHASPDAPPVDIVVAGSPLFQNLDYRQGTPFATVPVGSTEVAVRARTPGNPVTVIGPTNVNLAAGRQYTVIASGAVAGLAPLVLDRANTAVAPGAVRVQVVHAAPAAPAVAVYVTAPDANLAASAPLGTFSFRQSLGPVEVTAGTYQIRVTPAGSASPVLFDSGPVPLAAGADLLVTAVQNTGRGAAPIALAVTTAAGANSVILDRATRAGIRVVHASPDTPAVRVVANDNTAAPLVASLAFPQATPYVEVPARAYNLKVSPVANPGVIAIEANATLAAGIDYTVYAFGRLASIGATVTVDDRRPFATQARVRVLHGSPTAGPVDVYVTAPGASIATLQPTIPNFAFRADSGFVSLAAGAYDVTVTPAGSKTPAIGPARIQVANRGVYTIVARDAPGGGAPLGVILLDDF
ncbi:MAG: DUF4397 domain-containing protein [Steroidobacteraceae bacterium]|jgi:hypothetical protein|nr:DUF4397 domain-containing protein [Steroidobacteraceae bacterium]